MRLSKEEKEAFESIKRTFYGISDEEAYSLTMAAKELAEVGNYNILTTRTIGEIIKDKLSKIKSR